jgi:hypothetical protein
MKTGSELVTHRRSLEWIPHLALPGTTHISVVERANLLLPMITAFLEAPCPIQRNRIDGRARAAALSLPQ